MLKTKNLSVFGPFQDPTGYSHVVRGFTKELYNRGYTLSVHDFPEWSGRTVDVGKEYHHMANNAQYTRSDTLLAFCLPEQIKHKSCPDCGQITINYTMFEADGICEDWVAWSSMSDYIVVPTHFNREGWINSGVNPNRVFVVPIGVDGEFYNENNLQPLPLYIEGSSINQFKNRFLNIQEVSDRKNLDTLLKAWIEATKGNEDSCLVLKLASYTENRLDFFGKRLQAIRDKLGIYRGEHAPIFVYSSLLTDEEIARLMSNFTHYISASRGEGWDMNVAASAVMGKQRS